MVFSLPGLQVRSELRDVICSDFEFDGTRAGIFDHLVSVTFFPNWFGTPAPAPLSGRFTPGPFASQGSITPHPFFNYASTPGEHSASVRRRTGSSWPHGPMTPMTPYDASTPHGPNASWPTRQRQPTWLSESHSATPRQAVTPGSVSPRVTPQSQGNTEPPRAMSETQKHELDEMPPLPPFRGSTETSRWTAPPGLGRRTVWAVVYDMMHPLQLLSALFTIELRVFSRLEFNETGRIVRHEDTWSLRELVENNVPFVSLCTWTHLSQFTVCSASSWASGCPGFSVGSSTSRQALGVKPR